MVSSAKSTSSALTVGTLCLVILILSPSCTSWKRVVMTIKKRYGDSGHPWRIPVVCLNQSDSSCSWRTIKLVLLYSIFVRLISLGSICILFIAKKSAACSTLSNAFSQSSNTSNVCFPVLEALVLSP